MKNEITLKLRLLRKINLFSFLKPRWNITVCASLVSRN
jgi:hypothetical protein